MKPLFIVFDGMDGSGKGEMISRLNDYLTKKKHTVFLTKEPTDGKYGKEARVILKTEKEPKKNAEKCLNLFVQDRAEHLINDIVPALKQKKTVICDRYYYSTIAFQQTQGLDIETLVLKNMGFKTPDIAFILDLPPELALARIEKRGAQKEKFEQLEFMKELRANFLSLREKLGDNIKIIDASKEKDAVFSDIKKEIDALL